MTLILEPIYQNNQMTGYLIWYLNVMQLEQQIILINPLVYRF